MGERRRGERRGKNIGGRGRKEEGALTPWAPKFDSPLPLRLCYGRGEKEDIGQL